ncbi:MAG: enoyl-ACP reductase FabI [Actinobacteria bacterium]|jgi:meromycolic acid enoyl-[acyl-carrier-protein] reductase|nr:enoyl-ACP reductase FabI [Actinomycetota bacterium]
MNLLAGKNLLITGVLSDQSIAFHVARLAQEQGANVILTSFGRAKSLTERAAKRLPNPVVVLELDVSNQDDLDTLEKRVSEHVKHLDGVLHSIGFAPQTALGGNFLHTSWEDVATAMQISAYSLKSLTMAVKPLLTSGSSIVGLDFDAARAWPVYDWMGVAKAALEATSRYLARDLGPDNIRCNLVAAGPLRTMAAKSIPGFKVFEDAWVERAPLIWDVDDPVPAAQACILFFSNWLPATTGEILHVDGGFHIAG